MSSSATSVLVGVACLRGDERLDGTAGSGNIQRISQKTQRGTLGCEAAEKVEDYFFPSREVKR